MQVAFWLDIFKIWLDMFSGPIDVINIIGLAVTLLYCSQAIKPLPISAWCMTTVLQTAVQYNSVVQGFCKTLHAKKVLP